MSGKTLDQLDALAQHDYRDKLPVLHQGETTMEYITRENATKPIYYAADYGVEAEAGSGFTKGAANVTALEAAITAASDGGIIILPQGRIPFGSPVQITTDGIIIQGSGIDSTTLVKDTSSDTNYILDWHDISGGGVSDLSVDGEGFGNAEDNPRWSTIGFTGTSKFFFTKNIRGHDTPAPVVGAFNGTKYFSFENTYGDAVRNLVVYVSGAQYGNIVNVTGQDCLELVDFSGDDTDPYVPSSHISVFNARGYGSSFIDEEAIDLGSSQDITIVGLTAINYKTAILGKTEPANSTGTQFGTNVVRDIYCEVHRSAIELNLFGSVDTQTTGPFQGPLLVENIRAKVHSSQDDVTTTPTLGFIRYSVEAGATDNASSLGLIVKGFGENAIQDFPYVISAAGNAENVWLENLNFTGLVSFFNPNELISGAVDAGGWAIKNCEIDAGILQAREILGLDIDGLKITAGANNTEDYPIRVQKAAPIRIKNIYCEGFDHAGIKIEHTSPGIIDDDYWQDIYIDNIEIRDCAQENGGETNPAGVHIDFTSGSTASQVLYGLHISGVRVYSGSSDYMECVIKLDKGDFTSIDGALIQGIGKGVSTAIRNSADLGANVSTDVIAIG